MRKYPLMIAWFIVIIGLVVNLIHGLSTYTNDIHYFEAYLSYILILSLFSFPVGSLGVMMILLLINLVAPTNPIDWTNIMTSMVATLVATVSFYWQWYQLFPKVKVWLNKWFTR